MRRMTALIFAMVLGLSSGSAWGQTYGSEPEGGDAKAAAEAEAEAEAEAAAEAEAEAEDTMTLEVMVKHGATEQPVSGAPVFLRAARPRGPFEPTAPRPQSEWTGFTNAQGIAQFSQVPKTLTTSGLRVHAVTTFDGLAFESGQATPSDGGRIELEVWDKGLDLSVVAVQNLRTVVELWEGYLVFTQYYSFTNEGETALDVKLLPDEEYEKGIPIELPIKAQGINVMGPGESVAVNSTVYWKGVLKPGARTNLQVRFSMSAHESEFTYEQTVGYPTRSVEIVVPLQTRFEKIPRLDEVELRPAGFSERERGNGIFGLRDDMEFVGARGLELEPGQRFAFQLRGLPFQKPRLPWVFLGMGLLVSLLIVTFARRAVRRDASKEGRAELRKALQAEREDLLDELVALEGDLDEELITEREYQHQAASLREQLALVMKKLDDLKD